jgi:hypothetical protein
MAQEVGRLPRKCEALSSKPSATKKQDKRKKNRKSFKELLSLWKRARNGGGETNN